MILKVASGRGQNSDFLYFFGVKLAMSGCHQKVPIFA